VCVIDDDCGFLHARNDFSTLGKGSEANSRR
jgi:hypothetical protein